MHKWHYTRVEVVLERASLVIAQSHSADAREYDDATIVRQSIEGVVDVRTARGC